MKIAHYKAVPAKRFDSGPAAGVEGRVMIGAADGAKNFCMRLFLIEPNGHTPCHSHQWEHELFIHEGAGEVLISETWSKVAPGTAVFVPGNTTHQIKNTGDKTLAVVCLIPPGPPEL
jgi:quercetin dioxygenase-like cupin family protein